MATPGSYRALVCITTCRRAQLLRRYLPHFARMADEDDRFALVVSLDGGDYETRVFCDEWEVPLIHSDTREGVGMAKNRVLERWPGLDYYFFVEDDVELVDSGLFPAHVELFQASGIHHFSLFQRGTLRRTTGESVAAGRRVRHGMLGGGQFGFYTGAGLQKVGGWHPRFAEYRRWGHTEHSYRFYRAGLTPAPFNIAESLSDACIWHHPPPVHRVQGVPTDETQLPLAERELIDLELAHVPVETRSAHHSNGLDPRKGASRLAQTLTGRTRYPLIRASERREAMSSFHVWRFESGGGRLRRAGALARAWLTWPRNPAVRHALKTSVR
jgi:hypothetical protein